MNDIRDKILQLENDPNNHQNNLKSLVDFMSQQPQGNELLKAYVESLDFNKQQCDKEQDTTDKRFKAVSELLFCAGGYTNVTLPHNYSLPSRIGGTIYKKETYMNMMRKLNSSNDNDNESTYVDVPKPPEIWYCYGGSVDYSNGTLHFPNKMPKEAEELQNYTIRRHKVTYEQYLFLAMQVIKERMDGNMPRYVDDGLLYLCEILLGERSLESKQYTPRKITLAQTKEFLHAWVQVYVFQKCEFLNVLYYYLYAGYVITITNKCGGKHEK